MSAKRSGPPIKKGHLLAGDLIALGSKPGPTKSSLRQSEDSKSGSSLKQGISGATSLGPPPPKKPRPGPPGESSGGLFSDPIKVSQVTQPQPPTSRVAKAAHAQPGGLSGVSSGIPPSQIIEVRPAELVPAIREAKSSGNNAKANKILAGALKQLRLSRLKPDSVLNGALTTLVKEDCSMFSTHSAIEGLVSVLKREPSVIFKAKSNPSVYVLAGQLLLLGLRDNYDWPESIAKVYIEDSLGDRVWVDLEPCKRLVDNICTIFQTRPYQGSGSGSSSGSNSGSIPGSTSGSTSGTGRIGQSSETTFTSQTSQSGQAEGGSSGTESEQTTELMVEVVEVEPRFSPATCKSLKAHVMQLVTEQLGRHTPPSDSVSRNLLRFLTSAAGFHEVRLLVAQKIEAWIQNPKIGKQVQDLLMTVATNCHAHSPEDIRVIEVLINVRLKTKLFSNQFVACIKELISTHPDNLSTALRGVVHNELGQLRSPSNMALLSMMIHSWPDEAAKLLGTVFQDFLTRKEDYLKALRGFLREVVRQVRSEFSFATFTRALMQERGEVEFTQLEQSHKERVALSLADLVACSCMLTANMLIREAHNGYMKGEKAMVPQLQEFFSTLGVIQRDAVWWVHTILPGMLRPQPADYKTCLRKVLFLEPAEAYYNRDNWPPESDRSLILHLMSEGCLKEDTLMRVLVIGLTRELPLSQADALDIADKLVARTANAHTEDIPRLPNVERHELFSAIFDITAYRAPPNIHLPEDYQPPTLAVSKLYWKGWILLLVLAAFNPKTIGGIGWREYPTLRGMIEMVMTNTYTFPVSMSLATNEDGSTESRDSAIMRELQLSRSEKETILEYENHLAASSTQSATITEANSYLLNQVTLLQPKGPARRLLPSVIELIKTVNRSLKLGQLLCRCRSPDFLLDVIKRQGTLESMKWLTELVESSHSSMEALPVPCLCEFLMAGYQDKGGVPTESEADLSSHRGQYKRKKSVKEKTQEQHEQLVSLLRSFLWGPQSSSQASLEVLEYFFDKLTTSHLTPRNLALRGLQEILTRTPPGRHPEQSDTEDEGGYPSQAAAAGEWLVAILPSLPHFASLLPRIRPLLLQACLVETSLLCLQSYILFLTQYTPKEVLIESSIGISQIIVDRFEMLQRLFQKKRGVPGATPPDHNADITLTSLLKMLKSALQIAIISQGMPQLSNSADFLVISFPTGQKTILHTALIQATFLLLSCDPPLDSSDFEYLLDIWFPAGAASQPESYTVDTREKATLLSDFVLGYMLHSSHPRVLAVAIESAQAPQLCTFLQQFGIPLSSMQLVLKKLDHLCESGPVGGKLKEVVDDPIHLSQCIEVQILRGATAGRSFLTYIQGLASLPVEPVVSNLLNLLQEPSSLSDAPRPLAPKPIQKEFSKIPQEKMEQLLLQTFAPSVSRINSPVQEIEKFTSDLKDGLKGLISSNIRVPAPSLNPPISGLITALHKLTTSGNTKRQFLEGMTKNRFSISLLRLITRIQVMNATEDLSAGLFKATLQFILGILDSSKVGTTSSQALVHFQAVIKSCGEQIGLKRASEGTQPLQKVEAIARKTQKEILEAKSPFENEATIVRNCQYLVESKMPLIEKIISTLAKQAIALGKEAKCAELLHKLHSLSSANLPIVLQCSPALFSRSDHEREERDEDDADPDAMDISVTEDSSISTPLTLSNTLDLSGLLVDWLELLDPDILSVSPASTQRLVFGSSRKLLPQPEGSPSSSLLLSGQGYLLARLTHESSWPTLIGTTAALMDTAKLKEWINPSAVLDFLWACLHIPCLWQGRVKKEAVVSPFLSMGIDEESHLNLTPSQLECLVNCILNEAAQCVGVKRSTEVEGKVPEKQDFDVPPEAKTLLHSRLPLLICCCHGDQKSLTVVVKYLQTHTSYPSLGWQLLVHLYHAKEGVILLVDQPRPLTMSALGTLHPCKLDTELHSLLSAMADAQPGLESLQKMSSAALLCRKMAIRHPALVIRQLPMLGWLLRGRAHLTSGEFRNRNHKHVFVNTFVLLDLLQPLIFQDSQSEALESCLEPFFEFLKNQCLESKKYQGLVTKFADFLVQYTQYNREKAAAIIYCHLEILQMLNETNTSKKSSLKSLVDCFPKEREAVGEKAIHSSFQNRAKMMVVPPLIGGHSLTHEQVMPFLKKLEHGQQREDVLKVLQDLEETSLHSVEILKHFVPELCRIAMEPEPMSCKLAHSLLLRHLKQSPQSVDDLLPTFMSCLNSQDPNVVMATVTSIPDLVLLCKAQDAGQLLSKLFVLATHSSYNCSPELLKAVEACTSHAFR